MKKPLNLSNALILLTITSLVILLDFLSKQWIIKNFSLYETKQFTSVINFFYTRNYGIAFSLLSDINKYSKYVLYFINIITIFIISKILLFIPQNKIYYNFPYALIIGGAIGNIIDRLRFGFVIDFIDIHIKNWYFGTFNIADISIFLGSIIILHILFFIKEKI
ncbi:hypothetical protein XW81_00695 [Buchnera aphidicola (Schlechtendalia chinensis)]|uniref:Lipoprotein signal peptidase n=1 Tax=Buchnera aphidicola subsp. Schlechtendalia chinensis TaxID=118110 RepID=A0A172WDA4_BUCSC|nr:signal peptidase II [Buchnera aphidicola]ANF16946.1 hypothetical protein XW81_00695 [Buchnera aphidicola (Schlechtendalia chinensis)]